MLRFLLPCCLILLFASAPSTATNAYDVLRSNGLPIGLLPNGLSGFSIDAEGRFKASLDAPCTAKFESEVTYNVTVTGIISPGEIAALSGVVAQDLFMWFQVVAIRLDIDSLGIIHFDVGVVNKSYPASLFEVPPCCSPVPSPSHAAEGQMLKMGDRMDRDEDQRRADI